MVNRCWLVILRCARAAAIRLARSFRTSSGCPRCHVAGVMYPKAACNLSLIHISEPTRLGMISYAVFCLKKKKNKVKEKDIYQKATSTPTKKKADKQMP